MPSLKELISTDSYKNLRSKAEDALLQIEERAEKSGNKTLAITQDAYEASEQILRYVHGWLLARSHPDAAAPKPFTHTYKGGRGAGVTQALRELDGSIDTSAMASLISSINRVLYVHKLIRKIPGTNNTYWVAPWPTGMKIRITSKTLSKKMEAEIAKDLAKFQKLQEKEFVTITIDLSTIPLPEANPEAIMAYLAKVVKAFNRLKTHYEDQQEQYKKVFAENIRLKEELESMTSNEDWVSLISKMEAVVAGTNGFHSEE